MHADSESLDGNYAAFGMVLGGLDTVDVIASVPTDSNDKPRTEQVMRTVYVETYGKTYTSPCWRTNSSSSAAFFHKKKRNLSPFCL